MESRTRVMWDKQNAHDGDRRRLFVTVRDHIGDGSVLYPGSYVDLAASMAFSSVTYVDVDDRAAAFFRDTDGVAELVRAEGGDPGAEVTFIHADYTSDLGLPAESFDLLVSLYAGFVSEACTKHLRVGGTLLVAPSHGDVAMAALDSRYALSGVVVARNGEYRVRVEDLDTHLIPAEPLAISVEYLHGWGRGIRYTRSPFAYLFTRRA
jgi:hypothetical protein